MALSWNLGQIRIFISFALFYPRLQEEELIPLKETHKRRILTDQEVERK